MDDKKNLRKPVIFIAEDIPRNLQILCNMLIKENFKIAAAGDGKQALIMIPEVKPDLILLDVMMPEMSGFDVLENLKKDSRVQDIPVIFLTAKSETEDIVRGFSLGAVDYITKPFNGAELISRVRTHLELKFSREELKELNATRDKFFSIIAHDLKNPLQNSLLFSDSLMENYDTYDDIQRKKYIEKFCSSTHQLSSLLENLLNWILSQKGKIEPHPEPLHLARLAAESIELLRENAGEKNISLTNQVDSNAIAHADKNMIQTIIRNLLTNAVKFTHPGGHVTIHSSIDMFNRTVTLHFTDTGIGIPPDALNTLFRMDVHKGTLGTAKEKGSGLGLILCKEFVEKNKGTLSAQSEPGKGSTFSVSLPLSLLLENNPSINPSVNPTITPSITHLSMTTHSQIDPSTGDNTKLNSR